MGLLVHSVVMEGAKIIAIESAEEIEPHRSSMSNTKIFISKNFISEFISHENSVIITRKYLDH